MGRTWLRGVVVAAISGLSAGEAAAVGYVCQKDKMIYWIKVEYEKPSTPLPCAVIRWLGPEKQERLWYATETAGFCEAKADEIRGKLISYGWSCDSVDAMFDDVQDSRLPAPTAGETQPEADNGRPIPQRPAINQNAVM